MCLTDGQQLALHQLEEMRSVDEHAIEVLSVKSPKTPSGPMVVEIAIHCGTLPVTPSGLPLRERERFVIWVLADFPFVKPEVWVEHTRFAGWPHVQWNRYFCLYQAPQTEWDPSDGMFGFIERLWTWLRHGALNELNPSMLPLHPPVTYTSGSSPFLIVPRQDTPAFDSGAWLGFATVRLMGEHRCDLLNWTALTSDSLPRDPIAPAVLLNKELPWEMPSKLKDVLVELESAGVSKAYLVAALRYAILTNPRSQPLFFVLGTAQ